MMPAVELSFEKKSAWFWTWLVLPLLFYAGALAVLTFPLVFKLPEGFIADSGDGLGCIWGVWWVQKALAAHQTLSYTRALHFPEGVTLIGHGLVPWKGIVAAGFMSFFSVKIAYNLTVLFSFVASGVSCYWLAFRLCRHTAASLAAGFIYTFSSYHFAHTGGGHIHVAAQEWLPVFLLCWHELMRKPSWVWAGLAALALGGNLLCSYYYFLYAGMAAVVYTLWTLIRIRYSQKSLIPHFRALLIFAVFALVLTGKPLWEMILIQKEPMIGIHSARQYSADPAAWFIPGAWWRYAHLTKNFWTAFSGNLYEEGIYLGGSVIFLMGYTAFSRKKISMEGGTGIWFLIFGLFMVLSLGPYLEFMGRQVSGIPLPYQILEKILPGIKISGIPVRMMILPILASSLLSAAALKAMFQAKSGLRTAALFVIVLLVLEYLPGKLPLEDPVIPGYVKALQALPDSSAGVMDLAAEKTKTSRYLSLFYQTIHGKPLTYGMLARIPESVEKKDRVLRLLYQKGNYGALCRDFGIRYLVLPSAVGFRGFPAIYEGEEAAILDLGSQAPCRYNPQAYEKIY